MVAIRIRTRKFIWKNTWASSLLCSCCHHQVFKLFCKLQLVRFFANTIYVFTTDRWDLFTVVQSTIHEQWARKYSGCLETRLRYSPSDCFDTFAFPGEIWDEPSSSLADTGENYHKHRKSLMANLWLGLTKTYNLFHDPGISSEALEAFSDLPKDKVKKSPLTPLQKHLDKSEEATATMEEAVTGVEKLRQLCSDGRSSFGCIRLARRHRRVGACNWTRHDFYEVDYLPENDRLRYTLHPNARREVLKRLLLLNHQRAGEEENESASPKPKKSSLKAKRKMPINWPFCPSPSLSPNRFSRKPSNFISSTPYLANKPMALSQTRRQSIKYSRKKHSPQAKPKSAPRAPPTGPLTPNISAKPKHG